MDDSNKKQFWLMINVAMELTNHPPLTKEAIITWWHLLSKYDYPQVEKAVDNWCKSMSRPPTPNDILQQCQHKVTVYSRLTSPLSLEANKKHADEVVAFIGKNMKAPLDRKQWARDLVSGKKKSNWWRAVDFAKEALKNEPIQ